jgi:hypothetical protein
MTKRTDELHELTMREIDHQVRRLTERQQQIVAERAALYNKTQTGATVAAIDEDERAARMLAKQLLNGSAPAVLPAMLSLPPEVGRDRELLREQRGIEIALTILADKNLAARAVEAVAWGEAHAEEWRATWRELLLAAARLDAFEHRARALLALCPDAAAIRFPMMNFLGALPIGEIPHDELMAAAVASGIVTEGEIRKAQK